MELITGTVLEGKVSGITKYGAFVTFEGGGSGLVHISEIAHSYVSDVHDFLTIGQVVKVKIISVTPDGKVNLSIKQTLPPEEKPSQRRSAPRPQVQRESSPAVKAPAPGYMGPDQGAVHGPTGDASFEEKLKQYMQDSDRNMSGNKLYADRKGGNRRRK